MNYQNQNEQNRDEQGSSQQQSNPSSTSSSSMGNEIPSSSGQPRDDEERRRENMNRGNTTGDLREDEDAGLGDFRSNETRINNEGEFDDNQGRYGQGGLGDEERRTVEEDSEEGRRSGDGSAL